MKAAWHAATAAVLYSKRLSLRWLTPLTRSTCRALGFTLELEPSLQVGLGEDELAWRSLFLQPAASLTDNSKLTAQSCTMEVHFEFKSNDSLQSNSKPLMREQPSLEAELGNTLQAMPISNIIVGSTVSEAITFRCAKRGCGNAGRAIAAGACY